ncbi:MAG TPA: alanine racemase [Gaiellaceae bacterium]|nr:alanine racemase [Gaiellaceae bacterium]
MRLPRLESVPTPALVLDRSVLVENIAGMAARAAAAGVALRPHAKTHKSLAVASLQREHGAEGLTVATVHEAECFARAGFDDVLLTAPAIGAWRLERIVELAREARVRVSVDSTEAVTALDDACRLAGVAVGFLWEVDCGVGRFGTPPGRPSADAVARAAGAARYASFDGLLAFGGHAYAADDDAALDAAARDERAAVIETAELLRERGIDVPVLTVGTTPTSHRLGAADGITEIRPGNYVFYDATQVALGVVPLERCALSVLATVVSRPAPGRVILDAGSKALAAERLTPRTAGFGVVRGRPELRVERLYEEQAIVVADGASDLRVGDRVRVVPNHACTAANLHDELLVVEDGDVVDVWRVDARGWQTEPVRV